MSFRMIEIGEARPEGTVAKVNHQGNPLTVILSGNGKNAISPGASFHAEIGLGRVLDWKTIDDFEDARSGIWQDPSGTHLAGKIHSILDYGDGKTILDVYIQNGPEIFQLDAEAIENTDLEANSGLEITVDNLYIYPHER